MSDSVLSCMSFNQDGTMFLAGVGQGYGAFKALPFEATFVRTDGAVSVAEMLFSTSLVVLVRDGEPAASPRQLVVFNTRRLTVAKDPVFPSAIASVRTNRRRLVVALESDIYVHDLEDKLKLLTRVSTPPNPRGLVALTASPHKDDPCYMAYPKAQEGDIARFIVLVDAINMLDHILIEAHKTAPVAALAFSFDGSLLASASEHGTVIRVFAVPSCDVVYEFRRGTQSARILHLAFDLQSRYLAAASANGSVHIFRLEKAQPSVVGSLLSYLPAPVSSAWDPERRFAAAPIEPNVDVRLSFGAVDVASQPSRGMAHADADADLALQVLSADGWYRRFRIDHVNGGDCELLEQFEVADAFDAAVDAANAAAAAAAAASSSTETTATATTSS